MAKTVDELQPGEEPGHDEALTKDNWSGYLNNSIGQDSVMFSGHLDCSDRITTTLEKMVNGCQSFDELKTELLKFIQGQKEMSQDVDEKWHGDEPEKWGLPRLR